MQRHIDAAALLPGSVTLVARSGRIAHLEAQGTMDIEREAMTTDAMFRIMSADQAVVGGGHDD